MGSGRNSGGGGRITQKKFSIFHNRKGLKGGRQQKKGQAPEMQGTGCGWHGPPVPPPPPLLFKPGRAICLRDILG